ncbi:MAG TPA: TlpA disulfide reductase family protein [Pyrinomonadaceae bacterium]|jgi:peroxiredoxin|nr:TlpA disulfide reductase family protein [Pyrinomonadaceae bacterium]
MSSPKRRSLKPLALALVFAFANVALAVQTGQAVPVEFKLRTADGGEITSEMLRGDVVVLAFGASWLPLSRAQVEGVQKLADQYSERNVRVYWVSTDSASPKSKNYATDGQLRDFAKRQGLKVAILRDSEGSLVKALHIDQLPSVVLLNRAGSVSGSPVGGLDPNGNLADQLAPRLNKLLAEN